MSNSWFRWYHGTCEDGKFRLVARHANVTLRDVIAVWALILEGASQSQNRGDLKFQEDYIASVLGFSDEEIDRIFAAFSEAGLIELGNHGGAVTNWNKRQVYKEDNTAAERKRRQREKEKEATSVTKNSVTPCHANVTPPDTDTDTDTEEDKIKTSLKETVPPNDEVLKKSEKVQNGHDFTAGAYDIIQHLDDDGLATVRKAVPGWDIYYLSKIFNGKVAAGWEKPKYPASAFAGWCKTYTKGKSP